MQSAWSPEYLIRHCHGYLVDCAEGHLGTVARVLEKGDGRIELLVATKDGMRTIPESAIRHFDAHERHIAVVCD